MINDEGFTKEDLDYINSPFSNKDLVYIKKLNKKCN